MNFQVKKKTENPYTNGLNVIQILWRDLNDANKKTISKTLDELEEIAGIKSKKNPDVGKKELAL